ncbi:MAG: hypothetical protein ACPK85_05930 [Methanosarcina sp.]
MKKQKFKFPSIFELFYLNKIRKVMNVTILSKKPKTLVLRPASAVLSWVSFKRDLARITPKTEKGIAKKIRNKLLIPDQKEREVNILSNPNIRLKKPLKFEMDLNASFSITIFNINFIVIDF